MTWTWKWKTDCHAAAPHAFSRFTPSAPSRSRARSASRWAATAVAATSSRRRVVQVDAVRARDHERVAARRRVDVHERDGALVLVDDLCGKLAGEDPAEQAGGIGIGHGAKPRLRPMASDSALRDLSREAIDHLASFDRPSASDGERRAAEWIADRLRAEGARDARVEEERAHGTYWWPLGLLALGGGLASLSRRRWVRLLGGGVAAAGIADDVSGGRLWFRRAALPQHPTWNVVAEAGDPDAERTVVVVAHHDAAHWSLLFAPHVPAVLRAALPGHARAVGHDPAGDVPRGRRAAARGAERSAGLAPAASPGRAARRSGRRRRWSRSARARPFRAPTTTSAASRRSSGLARTAARAARRGHPRPARLHRLGGVVHGGHAGVRARGTSPRCPVDRTHVICVDTVGSPDAHAARGRGHARHARLPARTSRTSCPRRPPTRASSSCAGCASATPPTA